MQESLPTEPDQVALAGSSRAVSLGAGRWEASSATIFNPNSLPSTAGREQADVCSAEAQTPRKNAAARLDIDVAIASGLPATPTGRRGFNEPVEHCGYERLLPASL